MEALWNLEEKWKISTQEAVFLFACTAFLVGGLCTVTALKRRAQQKQLVIQEPKSEGPKRSESRPGCGGSVKKTLMGSVRWSNARKWAESSSSESRKEKAVPLLVRRDREAEVGWQSHNSASPVWQRPILMGGKCELPRFSGLILYDESGRPVHTSNEGTTHKETSTAVVKTTLRDLL
ncbi:Insulin-like receptor subunit beta [Actinidia chinensis var. chinensis]|uniref:Insulin-like receptor subunit beta n=1 Tax=Actinidia chinensis var. chinensis TaxID=1590841 RepID=A0A2R6PR77_ACTCC|nr:Insulin-like receptor subunit beta [Actinidia chinensis var. chinensis]